MIALILRVLSFVQLLPAASVHDKRGKSGRLSRRLISAQTERFRVISPTNERPRQPAKKLRSAERLRSMIRNAFVTHSPPPPTTTTKWGRSRAKEREGDGKREARLISLTRRDGRNVRASVKDDNQSRRRLRGAAADANERGGGKFPPFDMRRIIAACRSKQSILIRDSHIHAFRSVLQTCHCHCRLLANLSSALLISYPAVGVAFFRKESALAGRPAAAAAAGEEERQEIGKSVKR